MVYITVIYTKTMMLHYLAKIQNIYKDKVTINLYMYAKQSSQPPSDFKS